MTSLAVTVTHNICLNKQKVMTKAAVVLTLLSFRLWWRWSVASWYHRTLPFVEGVFLHGFWTEDFIMLPDTSHI